ncbi:MAG: DsbA family protein [Actinomycetota bacterium]|nr:DsbA family protein [Actinomycetota bacterium]
MVNEPKEVDFHFDVMCPWAYQTSKWIRRVRDQNGLIINWKFFSLEEVNLREGKKHPWERDWSYGWSMMRIGAILRRESMDGLDKWYEISGRALHEEGRRPHDPDVAKELLEEIGMDPQIVDISLADQSTHDEIKEDHQRVIDAGGYGVPTLFFEDHALYGPVLVDPPEGEEAMRLWAAVTAWLEFPYLYEMQKPKTGEDEQHIFEVFRPYLEARDWVSINRGKVIEFSDENQGTEKP